MTTVHDLTLIQSASPPPEPAGRSGTTVPVISRVGTSAGGPVSGKGETASDRVLVPDEVTVRPWSDPVLDGLGHDPRSAYVETYWLGILGPSATWFLRRVAAYLEREPGGFSFDPAEWSGWLGTRCSGPNSSFARTLRRCIHYGMARLPGGEDRDTAFPRSVEVRRRLPTLSSTQVRRLPADLRHGHHVAVERGDVKPVVTVLRERSRSLALSLVRLGEELPAIERQLMRWRFHPSLARESAAWAWDRRSAE